ncbi:hypothetical protein FJ948_06185 [Mesorhizobium sp. B2-3-12]|nr:hypothetical protein FJ948_06185 [Mesorhizobium sp. B2-3-12]
MENLCCIEGVVSRSIDQRLAKPPIAFVILWRSKERSDAAQTIGSMPRLQSVAAVPNFTPLRSSTEVTEWILGSSRRRFAAASTKLTGLALTPPAGSTGQNLPGGDKGNTGRAR